MDFVLPPPMQVCSGEPADVPSFFSLDSGRKTPAQDSGCDGGDFVAIPGSSPRCQRGAGGHLATDSRYCGTALNGMSDVGINVAVCGEAGLQI